MAEFEINGATYSAKKMPANVQLQVLRRLLPIVSSYEFLRGAIPMALKAFYQDDGEGPKFSTEDFDVVAKSMSAVGEAVAGLKDDDFDFVIASCLGVVSRKDGVGWQSVWNKQAKQAQYADISAPVQLKIVYHVLSEELRGFFSESGLNFLAAPQA